MTTGTAGATAGVMVGAITVGAMIAAADAVPPKADRKSPRSMKS
jgi:hypothetical protein